MKIAVLGLQGAVSEHISSVEKALGALNTQGSVFPAKDANSIASADGLIIPGGESTTISKLIRQNSLHSAIRSFAKAKPVLATCAGMVLISSKAHRTKNLLSLIDMSVERNAFGPQRESFETSITYKNRKFPAVFIRAPIVSLLRDKDAKVISRFQNKIVGVQKGKITALSFHPELSEDLSIHKEFINLCSSSATEKSS